MDINALELVYRNSASSEELKAALLYHGVSEDQLHRLAAEHGWAPGPAVVKSFATLPSLEDVDPEYIDSSNKAAIRRLHTLLEYTVTRLHGEAEELSTAALIDQLEHVVKIREKLTKLELPLYGLTTAEPLAIKNPINIFLSDEQ